MKYFILLIEILITIAIAVGIVYINEITYLKYPAVLWAIRVCELFIAWTLGYNFIYLHNKLWRKLS